MVEVKSDAGLHCNRKCPLKEHVALIYDMTRACIIIRERLLVNGGEERVLKKRLGRALTS